MNPELIERKLSAFLHDPIDKPFVLMIERHDRRAELLAELLGIRINIDDATPADWIASAMDRLLIPKIGRNNPDFQVRFAQSPKILHPLSCEVLNLEDLPELSEVKDVIERCMKKIYSMNLNREQLYFYLIRNLRQDLKDASDPSWSKIWDIIPADTRVPDHTMWDHIKVTCACSASSGRNQEILYNQLSTFIFSIGPVQKFIQTARKTQDLWMGSYILSYLNWIAIQEVINEYGVDCIIYPDLYEQPFVDHWLKKKGIKISKDINLTLPTIPNRFLAILPNDKIEEIGKKLKTSVQREFKNIAKKVFDKFFSDMDWQNTYASKMFDSQIDNFLEIYWVGLPWFSSDEKQTDWEIAIEKLRPYFMPGKIAKYNDFLISLKDKGEYPPNIGTLYGLLHEMAEKSLGAIKNIRVFNQIEETGRKCSLCGERGIIRFNEHSNVSESMRKWHELRRKNIGYFNENEALCAVCLTKRAGDIYFSEKLGLSNISFPSTSEVSTASFKKRISESKELIEAYRYYVENVKKLLPVNTIDNLPNIRLFDGDIDGEWLYPENLDVKYIENEQDRIISENDQEKLLCILKKLTKQVNYVPSKYYAIIMMDGDNMGQWLSGDLLPELSRTLHPKIKEHVQKAYGDILDGKRMIKPSIHAFISSALKDFSLKMVTEIVENRHLGKIVYTGGDDVFALVNLSDLFDVMVELRSAFSGHLDNDFNINFEKTSCSGFIETEDGYYLTMGKEATASMGVVIAHYKMPLREAMQWLWEMEKEAKSLDGKDAFAIALMKHSGEIRKAVCHWTYDGRGINTIKLMKELTEKLNKGLSDKFIYNIREEFSRLISEDAQIPFELSIFESELRRLMLRAKGNINKDEINKLSVDMAKFFSYTEFDNFMNLLEIVNSVAKG